MGTWSLNPPDNVCPLSARLNEGNCISLFLTESDYRDSSLSEGL